jgi:DNA polymerase III delta prime subunit
VCFNTRELINEKLKAMDVNNGEDLTPDDIHEIHRQADSEMRAKMNLHVKTRNKRGEVEDFLEVRRPFGASGQNRI